MIRDRSWGNFNAKSAKIIYFSPVQRVLYGSPATLSPGGDGCKRMRAGNLRLFLVGPPGVEAPGYPTTPDQSGFFSPVQRASFRGNFIAGRGWMGKFRQIAIRFLPIIFSAVQPTQQKKPPPMPFRTQQTWLYFRRRVLLGRVEDWWGVESAVVPFEWEQVDSASVARYWPNCMY